MKDMPEHLPELPSGWVYAGVGDAAPRGVECMFCHDGDECWEHGPRCSQNEHQHYAIRSDSKLGRKILAERGKPSWEDAPEDATHLAQEDDGDWVWFLNCERDPTPAICSGWDFYHCGHSADHTPVRTDCGTNPNWFTTLERRPESAQVDRYARAHKPVQDDLAEWLETTPDGWDLSPDLIIPHEVCDDVDILGDIVSRARMAGWDIEWDECGVRGYRCQQS